MWNSASGKEENSLTSFSTSQELVQTLGKLSHSWDNEAPDWITGRDCRICVTEGLKEAVRKYLSGRENYHIVRADPSLVRGHELDGLEDHFSGARIFSITTWMKRAHSQKRARILPLKTQRPVLVSGKSFRMRPADFCGLNASVWRN